VSRALAPALVVGGVAAITNVAILLLGRLLGLDFAVQPAGQAPMTVGVVMVLATTLLPVAIGAAVLAVMRSRGRRAHTLLAGVGLTLGIITTPAPFTASADLGTQVALASMHLTTGVIWFAVLRGRMTAQGARREG